MTPKFNNLEKPFIIAEIGGNHEGDFEYAKKLLVLASKSGADAVKFQTYKGDKIVSPIEGPVRNKHFKKFELDDDQYIELVNLAKENNIMFMSSVWDKDSLELLDPYIEIHKIGSGDFTNFPLIKAIAEKNKPMIISTAMSTLEEVKEVVSFIKSANPEIVKNNKLCLLQCVAMYGEPKDEYANLLAMKKLQDEFADIPVGYSDHTIGIKACNIALGMGARVIEKHFTDDKTREFRDHHISATVEEFQQMKPDETEDKVLMGKYEKVPVAEIETTERIQQFRRAVYPSKDLKAGDVLEENNLTTLRPNKGIDARKFYNILGKTINKNKKAFEAIYESDLD